MPKTNIDELVDTLRKSSFLKGVFEEDRESLAKYFKQALLTVQEQTRREERERIKKWSIDELMPIHEQLKTETHEDLREYLIGKRNQLHDLQMIINI